MGLLDSMENEAVTKVLGGSTNPMAASLLHMIQNQPGGLQGMVQSFHDKGLSGLVSSWVGGGQNMPVSADQIHQVFGSDQVKALAEKAGVSPDMATAAIAGILPSLIDKLTPNGAVPEHSNVMSMVGGLLQNMQKAS
jgi:uncharacterized protein YidB (DUF937 family)